MNTIFICRHTKQSSNDIKKYGSKKLKILFKINCLTTIEIRFLRNGRNSQICFSLIENFLDCGRVPLQTDTVSSNSRRSILASLETCAVMHACHELDTGGHTTPTRVYAL